MSDRQILIVTTEDGAAILELANIPVRRIDLGSIVSSPIVQSKPATPSEHVNGRVMRKGFKKLYNSDTRLMLGIEPPKEVARHSLWQLIKNANMPTFARRDVNDLARQAYSGETKNAWSPYVTEMIRRGELRLTSKGF